MNDNEISLDIYHNEINLDIYDIGKEDTNCYYQPQRIKLINEDGDLHIIIKIEADYGAEWSGMNKINITKLVNVLTRELGHIF